MRNKKLFALSFLVLALLIGWVAAPAFAKKPTPSGNAFGWDGDRGHSMQLGPRPYYLVADMDESKLKTELEQCSEGPFKKTDFSIGHRGAGLQFPEHTLEGYLAAARMGAGIIECDVTFTKDRELVCRHSQCDLHTTTDVLAREDLRWKCSVPSPLNFPLPVSCQTAALQVLHQRHHTGRVQVALRQNGCGKPQRDHHRGVHETPRPRLAHRSLRHLRHFVTATRESIELFKEPWCKDEPGAQVPERAYAV